MARALSDSLRSDAVAVAVAPPAVAAELRRDVVRDGVQAALAPTTAGVGRLGSVGDSLPMVATEERRDPSGDDEEAPLSVAGSPPDGSRPSALREEVRLR
jgi:hypothetical protein